VNKALESWDVMTGNSLQDPMNDIAPLFAMVMNVAVTSLGGLIEKTIDKAGDMAKSAGDAAGRTVAKVSAHVDNFSNSPSDTPKTVRDVKAEQVAIGIESPAIPEQVKSSALNVARAEAITQEVRDVAQIPTSATAVGYAQTQAQVMSV